MNLFFRTLSKHRNGFTIIEIMVTFIIIAVIAAYATPVFRKKIVSSHFKDITIKLNTIHGANEIYKAMNGDYLTTDGAVKNLDFINTNLGLSVTEGDGYESSMTWHYQNPSPEAGDGPHVWIKYIRFTHDYTVNMCWNIPLSTDSPPRNPCCSAGDQCGWSPCSPAACDKVP